jgi:predicted dehydrogenase
MSSRPDLQDPSASDVTRRDFLKGGVAAGVVAGGGLGAFYFGYNAAIGSPVRVGVIGTGDEGSVLLGAVNPSFVQVVSIADIRPFNQWRAFHGDHASEAALEARPGLMKTYGWKTEDEARRHVKVYKQYEDLIANAKADGVEGVIIALPLHLHAPCAVMAMRHGLHVLTEKLMGQTVHECKEMGRVSEETHRMLATGHQRHYNVLYAQAVDQIKRNVLGDLHYIRAQWHRGNLPDRDSWKMPLPPGVKVGAKGEELEVQTRTLLDNLKKAKTELKEANGAQFEKALIWVKQLEAQVADDVLHTEKDESGKTLAEQYGYQPRQHVYTGPKGPVTYDRPAIEELIRWRLWDRTGAGLMAELGSHQLDAASIFITAAHQAANADFKGKVKPLSVVAAANRPLFPPDRDVEDHVYCIIEFPAPGYEPDDPQAVLKRVGVQYASVNGNGFGNYGEIVYGTKGTLILEREQTTTMVPSGSSGPSTMRMAGGGGGPTLDTQASGAQGPAVKGAEAKVSRGYTEEIEHWAWCIRNPSSENKPRCYPEVAMGDAIIALVTNTAAREAKRIEFKKEWFDIHSDETPEGVKPDVNRYKA